MKYSEYSKESLRDMTSPRMYVSAPIFGQDSYTRHQKFELGRKIAENSGFIPIVPPDLVLSSHLGPCPPGRRTEGSAHAEACHFKADIAALINCAGILMMDGWVSSWGCKLELHIATLCGVHAYVPYESPEGTRLKRL